jgi:hypothetical protein
MRIGLHVHPPAPSAIIGRVLRFRQQRNFLIAKSVGCPRGWRVAIGRKDVGRIAFATLTLALLALGGCESGTPEEDTTKIQVPEGDYQARLEAMPEGQRNAVFIRALRDAKRDCQGVLSSAYQGLIQTRPTWTARCDDGVGWVIIIGKAGVAEVVNLVEAERAGLIKPGSK